MAGPLSDRLGRRRPLVTGLTLYLLTSAACAFAPSVPVPVLVRLLQGLSGAAGLVISRAVARDLFSGRQLVVAFSRLILVSRLAPVIAPVLGGQLGRVMSWRGIFAVLAGSGLVLLPAGALGLPETLPEQRRTTGGLGTTLRGFAALLGTGCSSAPSSPPGWPPPPCSPTSPAPPSCCRRSTTSRRRASPSCSAPTRSASWR